jgi:GxxExxY protein
LNQHEPIDPEAEHAGRAIVDSAIAVHRELGPGLLESVYELCLFDELHRRRLRVERQVAAPVSYKDRFIETGFRIDLLVQGAVIVEIKAVDQVLPVHRAQLLTYLKLTRLRLGLLINFNSAPLKSGIQRFVL